VSRSSDSSHIHDLSRSISHEGPSKERNKESARGSDRTKKKSWYNVLYPTYKSRSEDFKRIFKDVPPEERLIVGKSIGFLKYCSYEVQKQILSVVNTPGYGPSTVCMSVRSSLFV
jgi:hypothetical protein